MKTNARNTEELFAEIAVELLTLGIKVGSVEHDFDVSEVMGELAADYFPGMTMLEVV